MEMEVSYRLKKDEQRRSYRMEKEGKQKGFVKWVEKDVRWA
jgi:hypothetical protein